MSCAQCGQPIQQPAKFCPACGYPLSTESQIDSNDEMPEQLNQITPAKPSASGQIAFSVINIVFGCLSYGVGIILGLVAMIFAVVASSAHDPSDACGKLKTAKILNIVGVVVLGLSILLGILFLVLQIALFANMPAFDPFDYYTY